MVRQGSPQMNLEEMLKQNPHTKRILELEALEGSTPKGDAYPYSKLDLLPQITAEKSRERAWDEGVQFCHDQGWRLIPSEEEIRYQLETMTLAHSTGIDSATQELRQWLMEKG